MIYGPYTKSICIGGISNVNHPRYWDLKFHKSQLDFVFQIMRIVIYWDFISPKNLGVFDVGMQEMQLLYLSPN
jgi:hypothetical protein